MQPSLHTQFFQGEKVISSGLAPMREMLKVKLSPDLPYHKVFVYSEAKVNAGQDFRFLANLVMRYNGSPVAVLPINLSQDVAGTSLQESKVNSFSNQNGIPDSVYVYLSTTFVATGALVAPQRVFAPADDLIIEVNEVWSVGNNLVGARLWVGVRSSDSEF